MIPEEIEFHLQKMKKFKTEKARLNYQRKVFGMAEHDVVTFEGLVRLISKVMG